MPSPTLAPNSQNLQIEISHSQALDSLVIKIETERLILRSYANEDFADCLTLYGDPLLTKFFDYGRPRSKEEVEQLVEDCCAFSKKGIPLGLFTILHKTTGDFIGLADLLPINELGTVEIGCILYRQYHNQGFPLEACTALSFDYLENLNSSGFTLEGIPISRVIATAHPKNYASQRLIKNLKMTFDKTQERFGNPRLWYSRNIKGSDGPIS
jgi:Acetyltransferases, including N-acetylases of ribosomal proteins